MEDGGSVSVLVFGDVLSHPRAEVFWGNLAFQFDLAGDLRSLCRLAFFAQVLHECLLLSFDRCIVAEDRLHIELFRQVLDFLFCRRNHVGSKRLLRVHQHSEDGIAGIFFACPYAIVPLNQQSQRSNDTIELTVNRPLSDLQRYVAFSALNSSLPPPLPPMPLPEALRSQSTPPILASVLDDVVVVCYVKREWYGDSVLAERIVRGG